MKNTLIITGKIISQDSGKGIKGLRIEAWDKDLVFDDFVGDSTSDGEGNFRITFTTDRFKELFNDLEPDLYFKIYAGDKFVHSTEKDVLWSISNDVADIVIK